MQNEPSLNTESGSTIHKRFSFRRLSSADWSWIHFKLAILVWSLVLMWFTPTQVNIAQGAVAAVFTIVTAIGVVVSVVGLAMSAQHGQLGLIGLTIEYSGIIFASTGPFSYLITQVYLSVTLPNGDQRYALAVLTYVVFAALLARFRIVRARRKRAMSSNATLA